MSFKIQVGEVVPNTSAQSDALTRAAGFSR